MPAHKPRAGPVGYAWLRDQLGVPNFLGAREARITNVQTFQPLPEGGLLVPARVVPAGARVLDHVLFALKHEGVNLHLLALALRAVPAKEMQAAYAATPNGVFVRKACWLWEKSNEKTLAQPRSIRLTAAYAPMFDPQSYLTGWRRRDPRWRIDFNGLGKWGWCPTVRRTSALEALLDEDLLGRAGDFAAATSQGMLDRALAWAYLSETEGSFAIEGEVPSQSKAAAFAGLLRHAHELRPLSEDTLVELQNAVITNPLDKAFSYRREQNRLQRGRGAAGVTYVPPPHDLADELMDKLLEFANEPARHIDPRVHAAVVSFAFVLIHPFMDGNGRLSRYLIHHCLGQSGRLPKAFVLPVSVAMKRHEDDYLEALKSFSGPARELCRVGWGGGDAYTYDWAPDAAAAFRYADLTACVEFTLCMAKTALEHDLGRETQFLADFDRVYGAIDERFDLRGQDLSALIVFAFEGGGSLSKHRRKQYAVRVAAETLDAIEAEVKRLLKRRQGA